VAAAAFGGAILLKGFPAATLLVWLRRRWLWPGLAALAVALAALIAPPFLRDPAAWQTFRDSNLAPLGSMGAGNFGLMALVADAGSRLGIEWTSASWLRANLASRALFFGTAGLIVGFARRRSLSAEAGLLLLAHFLSYNHVWEHHMSAAIVASALVLRGVQSAGDVGRAWSWTLAALLVLLAVPTPLALIGLDPASWSRADLLLLQSSKALPTLALFVTGAVWLLGTGKGDRQRGQARGTGKGSALQPRTPTTRQMQ
jgi:hypothetical protein